MRGHVICPSDVICASRVESYKANIISLWTCSQYHFCEVKISRGRSQHITFAVQFTFHSLRQKIHRFAVDFLMKRTLRCMKNEAELCSMKRGFATRRGLSALYFIKWARIFCSNTPLPHTISYSLRELLFLHPWTHYAFKGFFFFCDFWNLSLFIKKLF